jgi:hypothetical protein
MVQNIQNPETRKTISKGKDKGGERKRCKSK